MLRLTFLLFSFLLTSFVVEAELSKEEKIATSAAVAANKVVKNKTQESVKQKLATVDVTGVDSELKKNIELHMPVTIPVCDAERAEVRQFFTTVKKNLRKASRALGYYDAEFRSGGKVVDGCWKLRLRITPGRPTKVISQTIKVTGEGAKDPLFQKILQALPYEIGDVLNHQNYSDFKTRLSETADSLGYFDAEFVEHSIKVDPLAFQAKVALILDTGIRYRYGEITVDQGVLSDSAIQKFMLIKTGDPFKTEDLINQQQLLQRSGYYKLIKIDVLHEKAKNNRVPIAILLTSKKRNAYKFKVGYGSDTGGRVSAEMNRRWTGSKGKQLKIATQYAENLSGVSLQLIHPRENPENNSLVYNIDWKQDKNDDVVSRSVDIGGKLTRKRSNDWIQTVSLGLLLDKTQVEGKEPNNSNLLIFGVGLDKTKTDDLLYPEDGWRLKVGMKAAIKGLLSDQNVTQFEVLGKRVKRFSKGRLLARLRLGATVVSDFDRLPKSLRFFAGGGNSVRGYDFESLGEIRDGKVVGGKNLLNLSLEYQYPITDEWSAAAFVDAGNAFNNWDNYDVKVGVGFGARWRSPIGPVRIDIGFPKDDYKDPHLHLSVGSDL